MTLKSATLALLATALLGACASSPGTDADGVEIVVEGNEQVSDAVLLKSARRELASFRTQGRRTADLADAAYSMERALRAAGHPRATVSFESEPSPDVVERVRFRISEGPLALLGEIRFPGRASLDEEQLRAYFRFEPTGLWRRGAPIYRRSEIDAALADVERTYLLMGYHEVKVGPPQPSWSDEREVMDVEIPIVEGRRFTVAAVELEGDLTEELRTKILTDLQLAGEPFYVRLAAEAAGRARRVLLRRGHQHAEVRGTSVVNTENGTATLRVAVVAGPVVRLGRVIVEGAERTRRAFVRERVPFLPGSVLAQPRLDKALDDLYGAGIFRSVRLRLAPTPEEPQDATVADLVVEVQELDARSVEFEAGWGSYELLRAGVTYTDRNVAGTGRSLEVEAGGSLRSARFHARVSDPHLLGPRYTVQLGGGYEQRTEPSFDSRTLGVDLTVRHEISRRDYALAGYSFRSEEARDVDGAVRSAEEVGFVRTAGPFLRFGRDARDDRLFPTKGENGEVGVFWSAPGLGADLEFLEVRASLGYLVPLGDDTVLALGGRMATRDLLDSRRTLPIQERLFAGGENSVRSFQESELGPFDASGDPIGGLTTAELHAELRQRLVGALDGALFYDVGTVGRRSWSFSEGTGTGVGVGLRYRLPVGPVRLDFGYNPGERFAAERGWALHLSFGFGF